MKTLHVDLAERSYDILIQESLLQDDEVTNQYLQKNALLVTNTTLAALYPQLILKLVNGNKEHILVLEDGEIYKNQASLTAIITRLLELNFNRKSVLIAFGGGVIGDIVGFAASIYQRGIDFIQIPTSLLAQVDSSVGGKTAINHPLGKNMIGTFHQPKVVLIDLELLRTLKKREYVSGLAEVIKYGFIQDREFLKWLEIHTDKLLALEMDSVGEMIYRSCEYKKDIVHLDERESGIRAYLNLGHTFGHAIERNMRYQGILHGEAVAIGTYMAAYLSYKLAMLSHKDLMYIEHLLQHFGLPLKLNQHFSNEAMLSAMLLDKKNQTNEIRFVLLESLGHAVLKEGISEELIITALSAGMMS